MPTKDLVGGALSAGVLAIVAVLVVPLPPALLDVLLAFDIMFATAILVIALSIRDPLELAAFPALLLITTLFRLSLDVSATRLILTQGDMAGGVGTVIPAFGDFVMRGNLAVGMMMIVILIVVQLVVVTNGAQRVAEVAARFTLDAMPGKQMAIDADLHSGLIDGATAKQRRRKVQAEADFYGAMDGAGKFVRGDAIAAVVIIAVNLIAGMGIGLLGKHLDLATAARTYPLLSIGNALATTLPAFLLSTAMGIMVTRAASEATLGVELVRQLLSHPSALRSVGLSMVLLALVPGLPHLAFGALGLTGIGACALCVRAQRKHEAETTEHEARRKRDEAQKPESAVTLLGVDALSIHVGEHLLPLLERPACEALLARIAGVRTRIALDLGIVLPPVAVQDDLRLHPRGFAIRVRDRAVAHGSMHADRSLAIGPPAALSALAGENVDEPALGLAGVWLDARESSGAAVPGAIVVDPLAVLASALDRVVRANAAALLGRQEVQLLLDHLKEAQPAAVKGVVPEMASLGLVQRVLQHLVRERVSVRDMATVIESIAEEAETTRDAATIGEAVRRRLAPSICASVADREGIIRAAALSIGLESRMAEALVASERGPLLGLEPDTATRLAATLQAYRERAQGGVVVCSQSLRLPLARFMEALGTGTIVLGLGEIVPGYTLNITETLGGTDT